MYRIGNKASLPGHALYDDVVRNSIYCDLCSIEGGGGGRGGGALNGLNGQGGSLAEGERNQWLYSRRDAADMDQVLEEAGVVTSYPIYETIGWMDLELHLR